MREKGEMRWVEYEVGTFGGDKQEVRGENGGLDVWRRQAASEG